MKSDERVNQFLKIVSRNLLKYLFMKRQFYRAILSGNFVMLDYLNKGELQVTSITSLKIYNP